MAASWSVITGLTRSVSSTQALTESAPTLPTDGVLLTDVAAVVPVLKAPNGQTFTGAGTLLAYYWSDALSRWVRSPRADDVLSDLAGLAEGALPAIPVTSGHGRFAWICSGVGVSAGTAVTLTIICASLRGGGLL